jgi:hypothetical protein
VLLALADYANDEGEAWPSIPALAKKSRIGESTLYECIKELEREGWIKVKRASGKKSSYTVNPSRIWTPPESGPLQNPEMTPPESGLTPPESGVTIRKEPSVNTTVSEPSLFPPVVLLPLNDKSEYPIYQHQIDRWQTLYPGVNVRQSLNEMIGWCESHPKNCKTKAGALAFITGWLQRNQNRSKSNGQPRREPFHFDPNADS